MNTTVTTLLTLIITLTLTTKTPSTPVPLPPNMEGIWLVDHSTWWAYGEFKRDGTVVWDNRWNEYTSQWCISGIHLIVDDRQGNNATTIRWSVPLLNQGYKTYGGWLTQNSGYEGMLRLTRVTGVLAEHP